MLFFLKKIMYSVLLLLLCMTTGYAQLKDVASPAIVINLPSRMLELYSGNTFIKEYPVAIGKSSTPTPLGKFTVIDKEINPVWVPPGRDYSVPSGPDNPLGYRWIGFVELYGIHGNNAPWSIGQAVSNGCVRMLEENVEELFEIVQYGTPVKVTYDRIKVRIDNYGQATVGIYPDVYGRKAVTLAEVNEKMSEMGLRGMASDAFLLGVIREEADKQIPFAQVYKIKVNDTLLNEWAVAIDNIRYVPVWPVAKALKNNVILDETTKMVWNDKRAVNSMVKNDIVYISEDNIPKLFGGEILFKSTENCLEINVVTTVVNGKILGRAAEVIDGVLAVPVLALSDSLGKKLTYDEVNHIFTIQEKIVPVFLINDQPYIQITKINEYFNADVYWNKGKNNIEVTYPSQSI
ncbi:L,D-transpeptidase family protein [Pelosinus sp. sgz500959]|uniref:L,D-transpeptidase family protein n=1 Tax=Pelosinus sp. sgz500959 TaxID=3242472 RepID=UPI00366C8B53